VVLRSSPTRRSSDLQTWQEMTEIARTIQSAERAMGKRGLWGFVFQGKAYEGLTCNALEWIDSFGGGTIVDAAGNITVNNPRAIEDRKSTRLNSSHVK